MLKGFFGLIFEYFEESLKDLQTQINFSLIPQQKDYFATTNVFFK